MSPSEETEPVLDDPIEAADNQTKHSDSLEIARNAADDGTSGMVKTAFVDEEDPYRYL